MLKSGAALCQPRQHILFKREAFLSHCNEYKLFKAVISEVLTHHKIEELVGYGWLAAQSLNFKVFKRLISYYTIEFILEFIEDPRHHRLGVNQSIVYFKTRTIEELNCIKVYVNFFFHKCVVVIVIDFHNELVLGRGMVVGWHLFQKSKATDGNN